MESVAEAQRGAKALEYTYGYGDAERFVERWGRIRKLPRSGDWSVCLDNPLVVWRRRWRAVASTRGYAVRDMALALLSARIDFAQVSKVNAWLAAQDRGAA